MNLALGVGPEVRALAVRRDEIDWIVGQGSAEAQQPKVICGRAASDELERHTHQTGGGSPVEDKHDAVARLGAAGRAAPRHIASWPLAHDDLLRDAALRRIKTPWMLGQPVYG